MKTHYNILQELLLSLLNNSEIYISLIFLGTKQTWLVWAKEEEEEEEEGKISPKNRRRSWKQTAE